MGKKCEHPAWSGRRNSVWTCLFCGYETAINPKLAVEIAAELQSKLDSEQSDAHKYRELLAAAKARGYELLADLIDDHDKRALRLDSIRNVIERPADLRTWERETIEARYTEISNIIDAQPPVPRETPEHAHSFPGPSDGVQTCDCGTMLVPPGWEIMRSAAAVERQEKCPNGLLPDGPVCPRCGERRGPSGVDGGTWVHWPETASERQESPKCPDCDPMDNRHKPSCVYW